MRVLGALEPRRSSRSHTGWTSHWFPDQVPAWIQALPSRRAFFLPTVPFALYRGCRFEPRQNMTARKGLGEVCSRFNASKIE